MRILDFIEKESEDSYHQLLWMAVVSGISNGLLLAIVNHAAEAVFRGENLIQYFILYMLVFVLFLYTQWFAYEKAISVIEEAIYNTRTRLSYKVHQVELSFIEKMGSNNLYSRLTQNDTLISQAMPQLTAGAQVSVLIIFSFLYLAYISPLTFFIAMIMIVVGITLFLAQTKLIKSSLQEVKKKENTYFKSISDMVNGFKEIKINKQRAHDILDDVTYVSDESRQLKIQAGRKEAKMWGFGRTFIYALLPILVFVVPNFTNEHADDIFKITATLLFIVGPITILVNTLPLVNRVNFVIDELIKLEVDMDEMSANAKEQQKDLNALGEFKRITLNNISFSYPNDPAGFSSGPFNESINAGELIFVVGGNGSGKSTFLKLLIGLYYPVNGNIIVNDTPINNFSYPVYRNFFSIVLTDFHLFEKLYGIRDIDPEKVNKWLKKMKMNHKVSYQNGQFSSTNLSTGQRKRLAFIAAILEDKPILILDEFAADQDPQFRQFFYEELLLELRDEGRTIIAVTHDDHYFHVADRVLKMDNGKLVNYE
jgi:putative ATP-binding cassette transporter